MSLLDTVPQAERLRIIGTVKIKSHLGLEQFCPCVRMNDRPKRMRKALLRDPIVDAELLADALRSLTTVIEAALQESDQALAPELKFSASKWRNTALRLLWADLDALDTALIQPDSAASISVLGTVGGNEVGLGKNLDSFRFDFAGPAFGKQLNDGVDATVRAASALISSIAAFRASRQRTDEENPDYER